MPQCVNCGHPPHAPKDTGGGLGGCYVISPSTGGKCCPCIDSREAAF